jgi:hypothetical protein
VKLQVAVLGVLICLAAQAGRSSQGDTNKSATKAEQSLTGCIDEQAGQYVLLDDQMAKIINLQSAGTEREVFAKFMGVMVQVTGTKSSGEKSVFTVTNIERVSGICGRPK